MNNLIINENWKSIQGFDGYEISDMGRVRSFMRKNEKYLQPVDNGKGYLRVGLYKDGKLYLRRIHRLMAEAFIRPIKDKEVVDHIDGNRSRNIISNLRICTQKENCNNPLAKERYSIAKSKKIFLIEDTYPHREYQFKNMSQCSKFFGYKTNTQISCYISKAKKRGDDFIKIYKNKFKYLVKERCHA